MSKDLLYAAAEGNRLYRMMHSGVRHLRHVAPDPEGDGAWQGLVQAVLSYLLRSLDLLLHHLLRLLLGTPRTRGPGRTTTSFRRRP